MRLMPTPDFLRKGSEYGLLEPLYLAVRVQAIEASPEFRTAMAPIEQERAKIRAEREHYWAELRAKQQEADLRRAAAQKRADEREQATAICWTDLARLAIDAMLTMRVERGATRRGVQNQTKRSSTRCGLATKN
jgi:hypothetical protein